MHIPTINDVAAILARAPAPMPWKYEAPCRALIRAALCRQGDRWWHADRVAFVLVARARLQLGVRAPVGGDNDFDLSNWTTSIECEICDNWVIQRSQHQKYCGDRCAARAQTIRALNAAGPLPLRCPNCGDAITDPIGRQKYCTPRCRVAAFKARQMAERFGSGKRCKQCSRRLTSMRADAAYCSKQCLNAAKSAVRSAERWVKRQHARNTLATGSAYANGNGSAAEHRSNGHANDPGAHDRDREDPGGGRGDRAGGTDVDAPPAAPGGEAEVHASGPGRH